MAKKKLKIHSENILPIIKQWLYSDKDLFLRELVANACDACSKLRTISGETNHTISIKVDKEAKTIVIEDTGIGMTAEEVEKYIAQIAFSGAEEFVEKYQKNEGVIGHFGLGFYSAYMVAHTVEIETLSYGEGAEGAHWSCDGSSSYTIKACDKKERGTRITLHIDDESLEYLESSRLQPILKKHCRFLPFALMLGEERINSAEPLWLKAPSECTDEEYLAFYRELYPAEAEPLFWIHLNVDYPFHLQGILYFPKLRRHAETTKNAIQLYCSRVFVSDHAEEIIPEFLSLLQGAIDSPDIPLNVSRSQLQMNPTVRQLTAHISKKVSDKLSQLHNDDFEHFCRVWPDIEVLIKMGLMRDKKFADRIMPLLIWKNEEENWTHLTDYLERHEKAYSGRVFYRTEGDQIPACLELYKAKEIEVLRIHPYIDPHVLPFLENALKEKHPTLKFQRIDAETPDLLLDDEATDSADLMALIKTHIDNENIEVEAKALPSDELFGYVAFDEDARRMRDMMQMYSESDSLQLPHKQTFVINSKSPFASALPALHTDNPDLAKEMVHELYELALLSQREMAPEKLMGFIQRTSKLLGTLTKAAIVKTNV